MPKGPIGKGKPSPQRRPSLQEDHEETLDGKAVVHGDNTNKSQELSKQSTTPQQVSNLSIIKISN